MRKRNRLLAIAGTVVIGSAVLIVSPFANAATGDTTDRLMAKCNRAKFLQGKQQEASFNDGYQAGSCDLIDQSFTTFEGAPIQITRRFRNCPPDLFEGGKASVSLEASLVQSGGKYTFTDIGSDSGLLGVLSTSWRSHEGTTDMVTKTITMTVTAEADIPENQIVTFKFVPKMLKMTANWHIFTDGSDGFPGGELGKPRDDDKVPEEVTGPLLLSSGLADGTLVPDTTEQCPAS